MIDRLQRFYESGMSSPDPRRRYAAVLVERTFAFGWIALCIALLTGVLVLARG